MQKTYMPKRVHCVAELQGGTAGIVQALAVFRGNTAQLQLVRTPFRNAQLRISFVAVRERRRTAAIAAQGRVGRFGTVGGMGQLVYLSRSSNTFIGCSRDGASIPVAWL